MNKAKPYSKINSLNKKKTTKIFLTISPLLISLILKNKIFHNINLKKYFGIYLITSNKSNLIENNLKDIKDISFISYHIVSLAYRFKRLKLKKKLAKYYTLPFSEEIDINLRYIISITELIIKRYKLKEQNTDLYINKLKDKYVNIILKKYFLKRYNINVKFVSIGKIITPSKQIHFPYKSSNPLSIFALLKSIPLKTKKISNKFLTTKILEISSFNKTKKPYHIEKNEKYIQEKICSIDFSEINKYGLNKCKSLLFICSKLISNFTKLEPMDLYNISKYNLLFDYFQTIMNKLYIHNISIFLNKINIEYLLCSHRSFNNENLLYTACKLSSIKSIASDFSLGYPLKNIYKKDLALTIRPDILMVNCLFRKEQYTIANKYYINSGNNLKIINCNCMQVDYAKNNYRILYNIKNQRYKFIVSIFDNNYGENLAIRKKYTEDIAEYLHNSCKDIYCIVHSKNKYFHLENELYKNKIDFCKGDKGDFSLSINADLIISIGFQGSAIKAASTFNKPIIFFSSDKNYFDKLMFFEDQILNKKLIETFNDLKYGRSEIELLLSSEINSEENFNKILDKTKEFLNLIGVIKERENISSYLRNL